MCLFQASTEFFTFFTHARSTLFEISRPSSVSIIGAMFIGTIFTLLFLLSIYVFITDDLQAQPKSAKFLKFKVELCERGDFLLGFGMEKWLSGRKRFFAKEVNLKRVPRVRIPPSPPFHKAS